MVVKERLRPDDLLTVEESLAEIRKLRKLYRLPVISFSMDTYRRRLGELGISRVRKKLVRGRQHRAISRVDHERLISLEKAALFDSASLGFVVEGPEETLGLRDAWWFADSTAPGDPGVPPKPLRVSFQEYLRELRDRHDETKHRRQRARLGKRLDVSPSNFSVIFEVDPSTVDAYLRNFLQRIAVPRIPGSTASELRTDAFNHLRMKVVPLLKRVAGDPRNYMSRAVKNFYEDKRRASDRVARHAAPFDAAADIAASPTPTDDNDST
jgi:hypothetical protein